MDPVTQYATDVTEGRVIAARLVRLACARHLRDLVEGPARGLEFRESAAQDAIDFFPAVLRFPDGRLAGQPFQLSDFQQFIAGSLFGWYGADGHRRFHHAYIETAKGSGKTPFGAGLLIYMTVADGQTGGQCFCAAVTKDQAKLAFVDAEKMVAASPSLNALFDQKVNNLAILETGCFIRPISAEKRGLDGKRVHGALIDELHEHATQVVTTKIAAGTKDQRDSLILEITNSGFDRETVCWEHHDLSRQILEQVVDNDAWFAFVCHLDACAKCQKAGHYQPSDECARCDDWKTEGPHWLKANPNLDKSLSRQYLRDQVRKAIELPSERNIVRRLNFCQWTQQAQVWIPLDAWAACASEQPKDFAASLAGRECYLGIDLSDKIDLSSVVLIFPREMNRDDVEVRVSAEERVTVDRALDVLPYFWMPKASLLRRSQDDKIPYVEWEKQGYLTATTGQMVDHDAIVDFIIDTVATTYQVKGIGIDQAGASAVITRLRRHFGDEFVVEIPQGFRRLNTPSRMIEALIVSRNVCHDSNPVMTMCMGNLAIEENTWREIRPVKISQRKRIDGGVALIDAEAVMLEHPADPESVYNSRGVNGLESYL